MLHRAAARMLARTSHASCMHGNAPLHANREPACEPWLQGRNHAVTEVGPMIEPYSPDVLSSKVQTPCGCRS